MMERKKEVSSNFRSNSSSDILVQISIFIKKADRFKIERAELRKERAKK